MQVHWPGRAHGVFSGFYDVSQDLEHGGGNIVRREREWTKPHVLTSHRMVSSVYKEKGGWLGGVPAVWLCCCGPHAARGE